MVSTDEATLIFSKWAEENIPLLFRAHSSHYKHSILCGLDAVENGVIRLRMQGLGHIEVLIKDFTFEYFDPATQRSDPDEEATEKPLDSLATGAGIIATAPSGDSFLLLEILFT